MVGKDIDPSDIGKHAKLIKVAQEEITTTDVLVCGVCHSVYHFIDEFRDHKSSGCERNSILKDCRETKPKVWAFLLWKATQLNSKDGNANNTNSWRLYQNFVNLDENIQDTWVIAGKTIQSFAKIGQANLQEMPVKITKTVVDNAPKSQNQSLASAPGVKKALPGKAADMKLPLRKEDDVDFPSPIKPENTLKMIRKPVPLAQGINKITTSTPIQKSLQNRRAKRTMPNSSEILEENVEKIVAKRFNPRRKMHEYLVKWEGIPHEQNTWEPHQHLENVPHLLDTFEKQLAKQKEQRAIQQAKQQAAALTAAAAAKKDTSEIAKKEISVANTASSTESKLNISSPSSDVGNFSRSSPLKTSGLGKPWLQDDDEQKSGSAVKRKLDDLDFDETAALTEEDLEESLIPSHTVKRMKNGNTVSVRVETTHNEKSTGQQQIVKTIVNGSSGRSLSTSDSGAEVVITKDFNSSGVVKKTTPGTSTTGEAANSGVVRIVGTNAADSSPTSGIQRRRVTPVASPSPTGRTLNQSVNRLQAGNRATPTSIGNVQITQVQTTRITPSQQGRPVTQQPIPHPRFTTKSANNQPQRQLQTQPKTTTIVQRTPQGQMQKTSPNSGKMIIQRNVQRPAAPSNQNVTPEQKIIQLSKSGDLRVTKKTIPPQPIQSRRPRQEQSQIQIQKVQQIHPPTRQLGQIKKKPQAQEVVQHVQPFNEASLTPEEEETPLTLCPITGKILGQDDSEQNKEQQDEALQTQQQQLVAAEQDQQLQSENQELIHELDLGAGEQQVLANEDGTPLLVTGEDGTIYQVAGKNAEGQTILIAQGPDGEQQFAYVQAEDGEGGGLLGLENVASEAVGQIHSEQPTEDVQGDEGQFGGVTSILSADGSHPLQQPITIQTGGEDGQEGNIPAEVVQAEPPSPGGTRRVVLLLQDGTFMMTEMQDAEYQALNLMSQ